MDQCSNCVNKGDMQKCASTDCGRHDDWFVKQILADCTRLRALLDRLVRCNEATPTFCPDCKKAILDELSRRPS
jgi:hypothetical protein